MWWFVINNKVIIINLNFLKNTDKTSKTSNHINTQTFRLNTLILTTQFDDVIKIKFRTPLDSMKWTFTFGRPHTRTNNMRILFVFLRMRERPIFLLKIYEIKQMAPSICLSFFTIMCVCIIKIHSVLITSWRWRIRGFCHCICWICVVAIGSRGYSWIC